MELNSLIDLAKDRTTSTYAELAEVLGVTRQRLNEWKAGSRPCPIERQAQLCALAELGASGAWEHIKEAAGVRTKETAVRSAGLVLALAGFAASGYAPPAEAHGTEPAQRSTMYRPFERRQGERRSATYVL